MCFKKKYTIQENHVNYGRPKTCKWVWKYTVRPIPFFDRCEKEGKSMYHHLSRLPFREEKCREGYI